MKELKSKKSGKIDVISDKDYNDIVEADKSRKFKILDRYKVTDLHQRSIIPALKEVPKEIKITKKTKE